MLKKFSTSLLNNQWDIGRYRLEFDVIDPISFPEYAGSTIRGAFGKALRKTACMTHLHDCKTCPLYRTCPYTNIFETPAPDTHQLQKFSQIPNPYIIEAPTWGRRTYTHGETLSFSVVLFGKALEQLALVIYTFKRAFSYDVGHGRAKLIRVFFCDPSTAEELLVFSDSETSITEHNAQLCLAENRTKLQLDFVTPLRLQNNGKPLYAQQITAPVFLMALVRRIGLICDFHLNKQLEFPFTELKAASLESSISVDFRWQDWVRYSNRQHQMMHMGGVLGTIRLGNIHPSFSAMIQLGQWVHIGKSATFGMGKYIIS